MTDNRFIKILNSFLGQSQSHELDDLVACDLSDGCFVHQRGVHIVRLQRRDRQDASLVHDDGIALGMAAAGSIARDLRVKELEGIIPRHGTGDHVRAGALAVQVHHVLAGGILIPVGHQALPHHQLRAGGKLRRGRALCGIHALDLHHLHLRGAVLFHVHFRAGIQDPLAGAVAGAVVLLHILHLRVLTHIEAVDAVVLGVGVAAVVDAAARHDEHVRALADMEIIVHQLCEPALGHDHRDVHAFVLCPGLYIDIQPGAALLRDDVDVRGALASRGLAVGADIVGALRNIVKVCDFS